MAQTPANGFITFIPLIILSLVFLIPVARILRRTGHSRWWCLLALIPLVNGIGVWVLAFVRWPAVDKVQADPPAVVPRVDS